jgi:heterodisulfide reductase subunit B
MVVNCAACYGRMKTANHEIQNSPDFRSQVEEILGESYDGSVKVRHFMEILLEDVGIAKLRESLVKSLDGLKVACYYGCLLVRPHEVTGLDNPENPVLMDTLVSALGGLGLDWPAKVDCCGGSASIPRTDVAVNLSANIIEMAEASGAGCIAVACPMCQSNLDLRQSDMERMTGKSFQMPVLYITQLIGLCLGLSPQSLGMEKLITPPVSVLNSIGKGV